MKLLIALLMLGVCAWGQQAAPIPVMQHKVEVAPLKCGQYQHVYHWPGRCGPAPCDDSGCYAVCYPPPPDKCVDDMHEVTEREWQHLTDAIKVDEEMIHSLIQELKSLRLDLAAQWQQRKENK